MSSFGFDWQTERDAVRSIVHDFFKIPCWVSDGIEPPFETAIRLHTGLKTFGDLDREGFAQMMEDVNQVVVDSINDFTPVRKMQLEFKGKSGSRFFVIETVDAPVDTSGMIQCQITPLRQK